MALAAKSIGTTGTTAVTMVAGAAATAALLMSPMLPGIAMSMMSPAWVASGPDGEAADHGGTTDDHNLVGMQTGNEPGASGAPAPIFVMPYLEGNEEAFDKHVGAAKT